MQSEYAIVTKNLSRTFGDVTAVDRLSIEIKRGEVFGLLGPNGAGKTTTVRMLTTLIRPTKGSAVVNGWKVGEDDQQIRRSIGLLTETPGLYDQLSAMRNLEIFANLYDVPDAKGQVEKYLRLLALWDRRDDPAATYSKGMKQKLAISRALLHEPSVLFLDEPTSGLDPAASRLVRDFIKLLRKEGRTIILCTHNLDEADELCDRIGVFKTRMIEMGKPTELRAKLFGRRVVFHLSAMDPAYLKLFDDLPEVIDRQIVENKLVLTVTEPEQQNPELIRRLVDQGAQIQFVGELRHSLEDVYLQLIKEEPDASH